MSTDKSGIRIKRVGPDEETGPLPAAGTTGGAGTPRRSGGTRSRTSTARGADARVDETVGPSTRTRTETGPLPEHRAQAHPEHTRPGPGTDAGRADKGDRLAMLTARETKPFFLTSEFLLTAATIAGLLVVGYLHDDSLNTWRIWLLVTVIASAYVLSRGIAKAGSSDRR